MLVASLLHEALLTGRSSDVSHYGTAAWGMLGFVFLSGAAVGLRIQKREAALIESRSRGEMLERMNRRGTKEDVLKLVEKIRSTFADPTLRTTFIVGFPGENRETMDELLQFVSEVRWDRMGAFTYSPEEDTPGSLMKPVCEESLKQQYLDELMKLQEQIAWENQQKKLGKVIEVLVEDKDGLTNRYRGRSAWDAPDDVDGMVIFRSDRAIEPGTFVQVRITEVLVHDVIGVEV